ncbi:MAG: type VI secretion system tube protein Hcp [Betaproteobacteria bacterium]|nr:type VI secretion system tube protein Hcp [Betaproteobacteria bacterium]
MENTHGIMPEGFFDADKFLPIVERLIRNNACVTRDDHNRSTFDVVNRRSLNLSLGIKDGGAWIAGGSLQTSETDGTPPLEAVGYILISGKRLGVKKPSFSQLLVVRKGDRYGAKIATLLNKDIKSTLSEVHLKYCVNYGEATSSWYKVAVEEARLTSFSILSFNDAPYEVMTFSYAKQIEITTSDNIIATFDLTDDSPKS